jgi:hypothetical protein
MESTLIVLLLFVVVLIVCLVKNRREGLSGYGVTSGLAFNDRMAYCQPGNESSGGAWSGGCFLPHKVII